MRRRRRLHPLAISAVIIAVVVFVTYYAFNQGLPFVHRFTLYAIVNNSVNVRQDSPVRIAGIDVGSVEGTSPDGEATRIAFTVDSSGQPIHRDATLRIRDRLFLEGGYYLELDPGTPSAPVLHDGGTIPESQTATPVQFYQLLSTFTEPTRTALRDSLITFNAAFSPRPGHPPSDSGAGFLKASVPQLTPTLKQTAIITRALQGTAPGDVETLLSSAAQVSTTLAENSGQLAQLVSDLNATSGALAASDGALGASISGLDATLQAAPASLTAIDRALPPVASLAQALTPSLQIAPPILDRVTSAVRELGSIVAPAQRRRLLSSLQATFQQFPSLVKLLAGTFPVTKGISDCLRTHIVPIFNEQVPDGALSSGRPVWQDFVHFLPNVAGASGGFDANGPYTRVLAAAGTNTLSGGLLGSVPGLGQLVGSAPPGGGSLLGARPAWVGDLTPSDFRPDVPCTADPLPKLDSPAAAADLHASAAGPAPAAAQHDVARLARAGGRAGR